MKTGPLTDVDKLAIKQLVREGKNIEEIKSILDRSVKSRVVDAYIKEEELIPEKVPEPKLDKSKHKELVDKLAQAGIHGDDAISLIKRALKSKEVSIDDGVNEIYNNAVKRVGARELMIRNSQGGQRAVAIMTEAASARGDNYPQRGPSRSVRGSLFKIDSGETE